LSVQYKQKAFSVMMSTCYFVWHNSNK